MTPAARLLELGLAQPTRTTPKLNDKGRAIAQSTRAECDADVIISARALTQEIQRRMESQK